MSVIIPAYNARHVIDDQLSALAGQDYRGDWEVVVGDNRSTDGLREHLASHPLREQLRLKCVEATDKQSAAHARNVAVAASEGDLLAFCDADDRAHPGWLSALVECAGEFDMVSGALETTTLNDPTVATQVVTQPPEQPFVFPGFLAFANGGNCAVWRSAFDAVGGWDESFDGVAEDVEFSWRVQLAGATCGHAAGALMACRVRGGRNALWRRSVAFGTADPRLFKQYRARGFSRNPLATPVLLLLLVLRNPLLPTAVTGLPRGQWLTYLGRFVGRVRGSIKYRVYFV
ncbi:glycosyltransferase family A protein [Speluncibacter jeojiensis]|uniref:Glycosyltransferase family 2 protein n=1 Tax=Speluncibacter jeojiensis TaxID=2710754 RepID=A0A9X4REU9_9ACTN|nr:glycosyltransferase family 2 protein [Corynebacteriales bacterium D3-21]